MSQNLVQNSKSSNLAKYILLVVGIALTGCAGSLPQGEGQACSERLTKAESMVAKEDYYRSLEVLEGLLTDCRGTGLMERTQFLLAESRFKLEDWIEARGEYSTFVLNFPSSPFAESAAFRKALSAYSMSYSDMRDDSPTQTAQRDFEEFLETYPQSALSDSARKMMEGLHNRLGDKDYQTAFLYWRMNEPLACAMYLKTYLRDYPTNARRFEGLHLLIEAYIRLEQFDPALQYLDLMAREFPQASSEHKSLHASLVSAQENQKVRLEKELQEKQYRKEDAR